MSAFTVGRYALSIDAASALLAGCGALRQAQDDMQLAPTALELCGAPGLTHRPFRSFTASASVAPMAESRLPA